MRDQNASIKAGIISGFACALLLSVTLFTPLFKVNHVIVNVNDFVTEKELVETAKIQLHETIMPFASEGQITKRLLKHPYVKGAIIQKHFPDTIEMKIEYRKDYMAIYDSGFYMIMDETLQVLRVDKTYYDTVLLEGFIFHDFKIGEPIKVENQRALKSTVTLLVLLKKSHIDFVNKITCEGDHLMIYTKQGLIGRFGTLSDLESNFNHFADIFDNLSSKGIKKGMIDVSSNGLPTFKPFD